MATGTDGDTVKTILHGIGNPIIGNVPPSWVSPSHRIHHTQSLTVNL